MALRNSRGSSSLSARRARGPRGTHAWRLNILTVGSPWQAHADLSSLCRPLYSRELRFRGERMMRHAMHKSILGRSILANILLTRSARKGTPRVSVMTLAPVQCSRAVVQTLWGFFRTVPQAGRLLPEAMAGRRKLQWCWHLSTFLGERRPLRERPASSVARRLASSLADLPVQKD